MNNHRRDRINDEMHRRAAAWSSPAPQQQQQGANGGMNHSLGGKRSSPPQQQQQHPSTAPHPSESYDFSQQHLSKQQAYAASGGNISSTSVPDDFSTLDGSATLEGPLPPELLIHLRETGDQYSEETKANAEAYMRRLLGRKRRIRVYNEELATSEREDADVQNCMQQNGIVTGALQKELQDIDARIRMLQEERELVAHQLQEKSIQHERLMMRQKDSATRTMALRSAVEAMQAEISKATMIVMQLIPSLQGEPLIAGQ